MKPRTSRGRGAPGRAAALVLLGLLAAGCGSTERARTKGPVTALRLRRPVPALARLSDRDLEVIVVDAASLPHPGRTPRRAAEVRGATLRVRGLPGLLLTDDHLDRHALAPEPGAAHLFEGEAGLVAPLEGDPTGQWTPGQQVTLAGHPGRWRLVALGPPTGGPRAAVLGATQARIEALVETDPRLPFDVESVEPGPRPPPAQGAAKARTIPSEAPVAVVLARRLIPSGQELKADDLQLGKLPPGLVPANASRFVDAVAGRVSVRGLFPGDPVRSGDLRDAVSNPPAVELDIAGLHPDWAHPGADAALLRAGSGQPPLPVQVHDVLRSNPGSPGRILLKPAPGHTWPRRQRRSEVREGGSRRWFMLLTR